MNKVHFSSKTDEWSTPQDLFDRLNEKYGPLDLDVCALAENAKCKQFFGRDQDGLRQRWTVEHCRIVDRSHSYDCYVETSDRPARCWMNPPYGRHNGGIGAWVKKAYEESQKGCLVVCLLPARTDTKWFHNYCMKGEIEFLKGRVKFGGAENGAPFPSMVVVFRSANGG